MSVKPGQAQSAPGWGSLAPGPPATAVAGGERNPLGAAEQPPFTSQVERLTVVVDGDHDGAGRAREPFGCRDRDRISLAFEPGGAATFGERAGGNKHPHPDGAVAEQL